MDKVIEKINFKKIAIFLGAIIVISLTVLITLLSVSKNNQTNLGSQLTDTTETQENQSASDAQDWVRGTNTETPKQVIPEGAHVEVVGANAVSKDNEVLARNGEVAKNNVDSMSPEAPKQTAPITKAQLPNTALKVDILSNGFSPKEITAKAGAPITLSFSSSVNKIHLIKFKNDVLSSIILALMPMETRAITFNAPENAGEYVFYCQAPGHEDAGETGKLIIK